MTIQTPRSSSPQGPGRAHALRSGSLVRFFYAVALTGLATFFLYYFAQGFAFFEGPGIVTADASSISIPQIVHIKTVRISPGMRVQKGEEVAVVYSPEVNAEISRLLISNAGLLQQRAQLKSKLGVANSVADIARVRSTAAKNAERRVLSSKPEALNTAYKLEVLREAATASQSESQLSVEKEIALVELESLENANAALKHQLSVARTEYNDGKVISPMAGVVGPRVAHPGDTLVPGQSIAEVYDETQSYIRWLMPYTKFRRPKVNDGVYVLFGNNYLKGYISEVSVITDLMDAKRTNVLREPEQGQIVKIKLENGSEVLPVGAQVTIRMFYFSILDTLNQFVARLIGLKPAG
jgi:multidrug resistance efflux pump